ncbi:MAG TPA: phosphatidylserine/phosphatidylglycerophosphate/cardiolipin synthase family protein [Myxococcales bacterium]|nr:phosphatidylserine/phosphatidylglycerophosphate/cardiolipin synthase family protein [Myxococcales bacterium]
MVGNRAENLVDGHRTLPVLLADLAAARTTIHISIFLFFNDPIGKEIERVLVERARAGVQIRILVNLEKTEMGDPFSTGEEEMMEEDPEFPDDAMDVDALADRLRAVGIQVLDSNLDYDAEPKTEDPKLCEQARLIKKTSRMDAAHVDHRKLITIDGRVVYCGSANFGAQYLFHIPFDPAIEAHEEADRARKEKTPEPWWKWHDGFVRFEGPVARDFDAYFRERWVLDGGHDYGAVQTIGRAGPPSGIPVDSIELRANQPDNQPNQVREVFLECISGAQRSIFIENPYVYHPRIIAGLCAAARRKVRVDLVVPALKWNDNEFSQDAMQHEYPELLDSGVSIFEYQNHFTHLKLATFDERLSIVGSANLNFRSLENDNDFELVARVESAEFARGINAEVRDVDVPFSLRIEPGGVGFRARVRDPRTLFLVWRRLL